MKTIKCQNKVLGHKCDRFLVMLTDIQVDMLRLDEEKGFIVRCPNCPPDQRWSRISVRKEDGAVVWETLRADDVGEFPAELKYDETLICEQVG